MPADKRAIVQDISFGGRTAEEEVSQLSKYFIETEQWRKVWQDEVDIVFAPKGGGKSAIYSMLVSREGALFDRGIILVAGENPTGATAFASIQSAPPTTETEFIRIWQLYFLVLIVQALEDYDVQSYWLTDIRQTLSSIGLAPKIAQKRAIVTQVRRAIAKMLNPSGFEATVTGDPSSGVPVVAARLTFEEPTVEEERAGLVSIDQIYERLNEVLDAQQLHVWLMLDRLDVAFTASPELEANALRALFRVYRLLESLQKVRLKIFLRSDIWAEITQDGFRETSHITRDMNLRWERAGLLQLISQRLLQSELLTKELSLDAAGAVTTADQQHELFSRVFPLQVDAGSRKPATFDWCLSRTEDGRKVAAPRELIHLFTEVRDRQLRRFDTGEAAVPPWQYFESQSFRDAQPEVSETRLQKTIYAEYPWLREWLERLRGQRTLQDPVSLEKIWGVNADEADRRIRRLVDVGIFEPRGKIAERTYWIPFLYRPALELVQGAAEGVRERVGDLAATVADDSE